MKKLFTLITLLAVAVGLKAETTDTLVNFAFASSMTNRSSGNSTDNSSDLSFITGDATVSWYKINSGNVTITDSEVYTTGWKMDAATYIKITASSDNPFQAGDVLTIFMTPGADSKTDGVYIVNGEDTTATLTATMATSGSLYTVEHTLTSSDIASDGSITFYRYNSNVRFAGAMITRTSSDDGDDTDTSTSGSEVIAAFQHISSTLSSSSGSLTASSSEFTVEGDCTFSWNGISKTSDVKAIAEGASDSVYCYKINSTSAYYKFALTSGSFQVGDVVSVSMSNNGGTQSKTDGVVIIPSSGTDTTATILGTTYQGTLITVTYTLESDDVDSDGSISFYRYSTNQRINAISISRETTSTTTITRNTSTGGWATFSSTSNATVPDGVKVYTGAVNEAGDSILLTAVDLSSSQVLPANTGFLLKGEGSSTIELTTTTETSTVEVDSSNELVPTGDSGYTAPDNNSTVYGLFSDNLFYLITGGTTMPANGAYIVINTSSESIAMGIIDDTTEDDSDTTGISSVETAVKQDGVFYNLQGVRVTNPTQGLYIVNGKKVVIK